MTATRSTSIAAATTTEDIRRAYYDGPVAGVWSWIREIELDPLTLIVDDDEGGLFRVPVDVAGDEITFGTPEAVRVEYVAAATTSASRTGAESIVFASRAESREGVAGMDPVELRKSVGLAETATDEEVMAKVAELAARPEPTATGDDTTDTGAPPTTPPVTPPAGVTVPEGFSLVADAVLEEIREGAAAGIAAAKTLATRDEDAFIARNRRRIGPASNPAAARTEKQLRRAWQENPGEAEAFASILPEGPNVEETGHGDGSEETTGDPIWDAFERQMSPDVAATRAARQQGGK